MRQVTQECKDLAQRILAYEAGGKQDAGGLAGALDKACDKLHQHLSRLIGPAAVHVLVTRSLELAAAEHLFLEGVRSESSFRGRTGDCLTGLQERAEGQEPSEVYDGLVMVLASILWLLTLMIGDDFAKHLFWQVWAEVPLNKKDIVPEEPE